MRDEGVHPMQSLKQVTDVTRKPPPVPPTTLYHRDLHQLPQQLRHLQSVLQSGYDPPHLTDLAIGPQTVHLQFSWYIPRSLQQSLLLTPSHPTPFRSRQDGKLQVRLRVSTHTRDHSHAHHLHHPFQCSPLDRSQTPSGCLWERVGPLGG